MALKELKELGPEHVSMYSDMILVINQVIGTFEAKKEKMRKYLVEIKEWVARIKTIKILQISCIKNACKMPWPLYSLWFLKT